MAAAALDLALDPDQVGRLRLALRLLESRPANLVLAGRPVRFGDLDAAGREAYLLAWGRSRLACAVRPSRPSGTCSCSSPTPIPAIRPSRTRVWPRSATGPTTRASPPRRRRSGRCACPAGRIRPSRSSLEADVVVVGSGAGGGVMAKALAEAGRSVVVVEAGPFVPEPAMPRAEIDAFDRLYLDHGLTATCGRVDLDPGRRRASAAGPPSTGSTSIAAPDPVRAGWARAHGIAGFDGAEGDADYAAVVGGAVGHRDRNDPAEGRPARSTARRRSGSRRRPTRRDASTATRAAPARSAVGPGRSGPGCGRTSRMRSGRAPGSSSTRESIVSSSMAVGRSASRRPSAGNVRRTAPWPPAIRPVERRTAGRPCPPGRRRRRRAADAGHPRAVGARPSGASAGTCCSTPCRSSPASVRRAGRDVARADAGGPLAGRRRRGPRAERLCRRVGPGSPGAHRARPAVGRRGALARTSCAGSATSRRSSRSPATAAPAGSEPAGDRRPDRLPSSTGSA